MSGLFVLVFLTIISTCEPLSIDRMMIKALEVNETDEGKSEFPDSPWYDFKLPELENVNETFVRLQIDMILTRDQAEAIYTNRNFRNRRKRSALRDTTKLWSSRRIPYVIDDKFSDKEELTILSGIQQWMEFTCLEFVPKQEKDFSYIKFVSNKYMGCLSMIGKAAIHGQPIFLAPNCVYKEIVIHEIGHSLGLLHEQTRPDRDEYVTVNSTNIMDGQDFNFDKGNWTHMNNYSKPYDYLSIMHYSKDLFSKNWKDGLLTIIPKDPKYTDKIGMGKTLSFLDAKIINVMYQCSSGCAPKVCPHNGYLGKNCECYCPTEGGPDPVMLCTQQMYCKDPELDQSVYLLYDTSSEGNIINKPDKDYPNGTEINIEFLDYDRCGYETGFYKCVNGNWSGKIPNCISGPCSIPTTWTNTEKDALKDGTIFHKTNISVTCPNKVFLLTCDNGTLRNQETLTVLDTSQPLCGNSIRSNKPATPKFRVIKDEGKPCTVAYRDTAKYTIRQDSIELQKGDIVFHMTEVTASCDDPDEKDEFNPDDLETFMICKDGNWDGLPPQKCPKVRKPCGLVTHAVVTGPLSQTGKDKDRLLEHLFSVKCEPGYTMTSTSTKFSCTFEGQWKTSTPFCEPNGCRVPNSYSNINRLHDEDNINVFAGAKLKHRSKVTLQCPRGHVSNTDTSTCNLGKWSTGTLPVCRKVVCKTKRNYPIRGKKFAFKPEYLYGDTITVERCSGNLELTGPNTISCERTGKWSSRITCKKYCKDGQSRFRERKDKNMIAKPKEMVEFGDFTKDACKRECVGQKDFLCRAISYGWVPGKGLMCFLYDEKIIDEQTSLKDEQFWEVQERICLGPKNKRI